MQNFEASIITIGDELLIGQTIDTNSAWIATQLNAEGIWVRSRIAVGDNRQQILEALASASREAKLVIITGGLGPTADDITKPVLCEFFDSVMVINKEVEEHVRNIFRKLNREAGERNLKQAEVPEACTVLPNERGTAPGMWFTKEGVIFISLPGVPHEMKGLVESQVLPRIRLISGLPKLEHRTLLTAGVGESVIADALVDFENSLPGIISLAYLPSYGMVKLRLTARGEANADLKPLLDASVGQLKTLVKEWLVWDEDISMQEVVSILLRNKNKTLSTAESCTGGYIASLITSRDGASHIFAGSVVAYSNDVKTKILDVKPQTLERYGAVSEETVREMAAGILRLTGSDYALATSGIMGPGGGSPEKPVGMVWMAAGSSKNLVTRKIQFRYDRGRNIEMTGMAALNLLRMALLADDETAD